MIWKGQTGGLPPTKHEKRLQQGEKKGALKDAFAILEFVFYPTRMEGLAPYCLTAVRMRSRFFLASPNNIRLFSL